MDGWMDVCMHACMYVCIYVCDSRHLEIDIMNNKYTARNISIYLHKALIKTEQRLLNDETTSI